MQHAWSPDGGWIAFTAGVENDGLGTFDLWLMRPDGSERHVLNRAPNTEGWQKWCPCSDRQWGRDGGVVATG